MEELLDWGWFGEPGAEPQWYSEQVSSSSCMSAFDPVWTAPRWQVRS
jgi:hypothetical protein